MARSAAQKRAFRKMVAGLRRYKRSRRRVAGGGGKRRRRRTVHARARRSRRHPAAIVIRRKRHRKPKRGARHMARRSHRRRRRGGGVTAIMVNPRGRRRRRFVRHARRRNPSGFVGDLLIAGVPAVVGGGALAYADAAFMSDKSAIARVGIKLALAGVFLLFRKKHPMIAAAGVATVLTAAIVTEVTRMIAASNGKDVAAGKALPAGAPLLAAGTAGPAMKALIREDGRAMGVLVQRNGMGQMLDTNVNLGSMGESNQLPGGTHFQDVRLG